MLRALTITHLTGNTVETELEWTVAANYRRGKGLRHGDPSNVEELIEFGDVSNVALTMSFDEWVELCDVDVADVQEAVREEVVRLDEEENGPRDPSWMKHRGMAL